MGPTSGRTGTPKGSPQRLSLSFRFSTLPATQAIPTGRGFWGCCASCEVQTFNMLMLICDWLVQLAHGHLLTRMVLTYRHVHRAVIWQCLSWSSLSSLATSRIWLDSTHTWGQCGLLAFRSDRSYPSRHTEHASAFSLPYRKPFSNHFVQMYWYSHRGILLIHLPDTSSALGDTDRRIMAYLTLGCGYQMKGSRSYPLVSAGTAAKHRAVNHWR